MQMDTTVLYIHHFQLQIIGSISATSLSWLTQFLPTSCLHPQQYLFTHWHHCAPILYIIMSACMWNAHSNTTNTIRSSPKQTSSSTWLSSSTNLSTTSCYEQKYSQPCHSTITPNMATTVSGSYLCCLIFGYFPGHHQHTNRMWHEMSIHTYMWHPFFSTARDWMKVQQGFKNHSITCCYGILKSLPRRDLATFQNNRMYINDVFAILQHPEQCLLCFPGYTYCMYLVDTYAFSMDVS